MFDYKFFCFNGHVEFLYVMGDRDVGKRVKVSFFDREFRKLSILREGDDELNGVTCPLQYSEMVKIAETLSAVFLHVRVDLFNLNGRILFGELTFYNASSYMKYKPDSFDLEMGEKWSLPPIMDFLQ